MEDFCGRRPERRAGIGQIFLNDIDDAIVDATWVKEHGLRGGVLIPTIPPDVKWVRPLYDVAYDPLWAALQDLDIPVHLHGGTGSPDYGMHAATSMVMIAEIPFYGNRNLVHMILGGVFERFPRLKFVITESGLAQFGPLLKHLDGIIASVRKGSIGELKYAEGTALPKLATEYFHQNVWVGASFPSKSDLRARDLIQEDRLMWGSDYPHDEGTPPFTREHLRQVMIDLPEADKRAILGENAAKLYGFDLEALAPLAAQHGPTVEELTRPLTELPAEPNSVLRRGAGEAVLA
jgi:predicted TIM-barrel fold metal-dependent hydrolase